MIISLSEAIKPEYTYKKVTCNIIVSGKQLSPYIIPHHIEAVCTSPGKDCTMSCKYREKITVNILKDPSDIVKFIKMKQETLTKSICQLLDIRKCPVQISIKDTMTIDSLIIIPDSDKFDITTKGAREYVVRQALYLGCDSECSKSYEAEMTTIPDPATNIAIHVIHSLRPRSQLINITRPDTLTMQKLVDIFNPSDLTTASIWDKLLSNAHLLSNNITHIYKRDIMTIGIDLIFHSPMHFYLGTEYIHKGWGEILLLGDTQCGKGATCERLSEYYGVGEVVSGENTTFAGLVGGIQTINDRGMLTWGRLVLNHQGLIIIDEISSLAIDGILRKLSRIRSEGISELDKAGVHARADACTRIIWIANPKFGAAMTAYPFGILAVKELIGSNEDITRFDFILTAIQGEVSSNDINRAYIQHQDMPQIEDRILIQWIWSRTPATISFSTDAVELIYSLAKTIPRRYSQAIPLAQVETYRIKLAKVAVMIAARLCLTDPPYTDLHVPKVCVEVAAEFLELTYNMPGLLYRDYSTVTRYQVDKEIISTLSKPLLDFLVTTKFFKEHDIQKYSKLLTKDLLDGLLASGIIERYSSAYLSKIYNYEI